MRSSPTTLYLRVSTIPRRTDIQISPHVRRNVRARSSYNPLSEWRIPPFLSLPLHSLFNSLAASIVKWCTYIREKELSKCIDGRGTRNWSPVLEQRNTIYIQGLNLQSTKIRRIRDISLPSRSRLNKNKYNKQK